MRNLVIFGDSQFAERLYKYIALEKVDQVLAFTQEQDFITRSEIQGLPVIPFESLSSELKGDYEVIIGIGYSGMNRLRQSVYNKCVASGAKVASYISINAVVYSEHVSEGNFICPGAIIGPDVRMGVCNFVASGTIFSHDNEIGNFNFFSTNAVLGGFAKIGDNCFLGLHSTIRDGITIADRTLVGAAANVLESIDIDGGVYIGNPAVKLIHKESVNTTL